MQRRAWVSCFTHFEKILPYFEADYSSSFKFSCYCCQNILCNLISYRLPLITIFDKNEGLGQIRFMLIDQLIDRATS